MIERYEEIKTDSTVAQGVLKLIDAGFCTIGQMSRQIGVKNTGKLPEILERLEATGEIVRLDGGQVTAYFRADNVPARFWNGGKGKTAGEYKNGKPLKRLKEAKTQIGKWDGKTNNDVFPHKTKPKPRPVLAGSAPTGKRYGGGNKPKRVDYRQIESLLAEGKSIGVVAKKIGIAEGTFYNRLKADPEFKTAVERGKLQAATATV